MVIVCANIYIQMYILQATIAFEGFLLTFYRIAFVDQDFSYMCLVAAHLPRLA